MAMVSAVLGAGSWGTALAMQLARAGHAVHLWTRDAAQAESLRTERENRRYLPGRPLPTGVDPTSDLERALHASTGLVVIAVPSHAVFETCTAARPYLAEATTLVSAAKGIEEVTLRRMSEVIRAATTGVAPVAVISGPSFAAEVAAELPTVVTAACADPAVAEKVQLGFSSPMFRVYTSDDVIGVEIGGSVKNVIAIATGVADGLGLGHNARAAIMTRGLAEIARLAERLGGNPRTLAGLSGIGDLMLTCTGDLSRNRRVGLRLGRGEPLAEILGNMDQVAEGVRNTLAIHDLAQSLEVEMPITAEMKALLFEGKSPREALVGLMGRRLRRE